jgi:hypothetical protein
MKKREYYVYVHRGKAGKIFYVGEGTGRRAWSTDRHIYWTHYVEHHLNGKYDVEIVRDGLTKEEAESLESELMDRHGPDLVNWINWSRADDFKALDTFNALRDANRKFVAETNAIEKTSLENAATRYREALARMHEYESLVLMHGLLGKLIAELEPQTNVGDPTILNRLTMCLVKLGRAPEAAAVANQYFSKFPAARNTGAGRAVSARIERHREGPNP